MDNHRAAAADSFDRHSSESGNPEGCSQARRMKPSTNPNSVIPIKTGTSDPHSSYPPSFPRKRESRGLKPSPPYGTKYESQQRHPRENGDSGLLLPLWAYRGWFAPLGARASRSQSRAGAQRTLILAFSDKGLTRAGFLSESGFSGL